MILAELYFVASTRSFFTKQGNMIFDFKLEIEVNSKVLHATSIKKSRDCCCYKSDLQSENITYCYQSL